MSTVMQESARVASEEMHAEVGPKVNPVVPGPRAKAVIAEDNIRGGIRW
jgi:hypothetical protein